MITHSTQKRTFDVLRLQILLSLASGQKTINQISQEMGINWKTVDNHLVHLMGKLLVKEVFTSPYARIFELTAFGKDYLKNNHSKNIKFIDNKLIKINSEERA